ncbi:MAG: NAD(P)/FAD-dependent oxidoreductase [Labilithrix sp.]|nr:NAD(P)/FAD-dependent oxidoreductase [Labilithrix sp.]
MSEEVDVVIVGAGILGIHQLYVTREAGFSVVVLEAGSGVGGAWYWNRYPGARLDSESFTYGFFFSKELFEEWKWKEHFAGQPDLERYFNYAVDKFDLRRHIRFNARVNSAVWDEKIGRWTLRTQDGAEVRAKYFIATTGVLSIPFKPNIPGRETFRGAQHHTGEWPKTPVDFAGKRVAVFGTGSSGVQVIPAIADQVASLTVYQKEANWCVPLNNRPITPEEQVELRRDFDRINTIVNTEASGFLHLPIERKTFDDTEEQRLAFFEKMWASPGFAKVVSHYADMIFDPKANAEWCAFIAAKVRSIVKDPTTAESLIPTDHRYMEKRPPYVTGYYETYNKPNVELVDLRKTSIARFTETGIESADRHREHDIVVWATGFDFGSGAMVRMGIRGRDGLALEERWRGGPITFTGTVTHGFPNLFFPGGPHGATGNNPRYGGFQVEFVRDLLVHMRDQQLDVVEAAEAAEAEWMGAMAYVASQYPTFSEKSYFFGSNIPGKAVSYQLNPGGRPLLAKFYEESRTAGYKGFTFGRAR